MKKKSFNLIVQIFCLFVCLFSKETTKKKDFFLSVIILWNMNNYNSNKQNNKE